MATQYRYDAPAIAARHFVPGQTVLAAGTLTPAGFLYSPVAMNLYNAHCYVTTAGTVSTALFRAINISGTTTTTIATTTAGTAAAGSVARLNAISTASKITPTLLAADSRTYIVQVTDATMAGVVVWEYELDDNALCT